MKTHTGIEIDEKTLKEALVKVANDLRKSAHAIRRGEYAPHVTEDQKEIALQRNLKTADEVESGKHNGAFWLWQKVNMEITGECVALLP